MLTANSRLLHFPESKSSAANEGKGQTSQTAPTLTQLHPSEANSNPNPTPAGTGGASNVLVVFEEILKNYSGSALPEHIFVAEDTFVKGSGRLIGLVGGGQGLLAQYTLTNLIPDPCVLNLDAGEERLFTENQTELEFESEAAAVVWCLAEAAVTAINFALPFAIWLCPNCRKLTACTGEETILACTGCRYIFFEAC